jgi:F-type H+-transporting ATPase subunit gamma
MESFVKGEYDRVEIFYNHFKNAAVQILTNEVFLPVEPSSIEKQHFTVDYIYEPDRKKS